MLRCTYQLDTSGNLGAILFEHVLPCVSQGSHRMRRVLTSHRPGFFNVFQYSPLKKIFKVVAFLDVFCLSMSHFTP